MSIASIIQKPHIYEQTRSLHDNMLHTSQCCWVEGTKERLEQTSLSLWLSSKLRYEMSALNRCADGMSSCSARLRQCWVTECFRVRGVEQVTIRTKQEGAGGPIHWAHITWGLSLVNFVMVFDGFNVAETIGTSQIIS